MDRQQRRIGERARRLVEGVAEDVVDAERVRRVPRARHAVRGGPDVVGGRGRLDGTDGVPVVSTVTVDACVAGSEAEAISAAEAVVFRKGRPVVALPVGVPATSRGAEAGDGEEDAGCGILATPAHDAAAHAVRRRPRPVAAVSEFGQFKIRRHAPVAAPTSLPQIFHLEYHTCKRNHLLDMGKFA